MEGDIISPPLPNSYWVRPGRFAAGEYPGDTNPSEAATKLQALLGSGINHFIDLTEPEELLPYAEIVKEEASRLVVTVDHERYTIADAGVPHSPERMIEILDAIDAALDEDKTVYLHCWGGVGRTGTVVGCWLVRHGHTREAALEQIAEWWQGVEKAQRVPRFPETREQETYVRNWAEPR